MENFFLAIFPKFAQIGFGLVLVMRISKSMLLPRFMKAQTHVIAHFKKAEAEQITVVFWYTTVLLKLQSVMLMHAKKCMSGITNPKSLT